MQKKETNHDYLAKLLIIGDSGVGKTNILLKFCENNFNQNHLTTIGIDFKLKTIDIDKKRIKLQIWDTAGQERYKTITQNYYKGAQGIILTYAVNDRLTFENIQSWMDQIKKFANDSVCKLLVGNKIDMPDRQITTEQGKALADSLSIHFFETSAKEGNNIEEIFMSIARSVNDKHFSQQVEGEKSKQLPNQAVQLHKEEPEVKKKKQKENPCC